jgi:NADP-dependent aldehyde dehydrogenase
MYELSGTSIIGSSRGNSLLNPRRAFNLVTNEPLEPQYLSASADEINQAAELASVAFQSYRHTSGRERGEFLRRIAENIESIGEPLTNRVAAETALPITRIQSETQRTCNQLRLFAALVEEGSWVDARFDRADTNRTPLAKPDVRSMLRPLGPVAVFCASNFPLAFSVAGGDTASALAAGNPVIVKAHQAHPGTAELVGLAIRDAGRALNLHEGVFSLLFGPGAEVGLKLIQNAHVKAGGFTGSRSGGLALLRAASERPEPIPFFAEMSSVNPVFILCRALKERARKIAGGLYSSVTLGAGQFCTNPGLVFVPQEGAEDLIAELQRLMTETAPFTMLSSTISAAYRSGIERLQEGSLVNAIVAQPRENNECSAGAVLLQTDMKSFLDNRSLASEVFGPSTLLISYSNSGELVEAARQLEGQLTATIHGTNEDLQESRELVNTLEDKVGRLIFNGFPTGVEVGHAIVHGGPFPATSDGRSTSVGTRAIARFTRPVCYQDWPEATLPDELHDDNPLQIWRFVDGDLTKATL